MILLRNFAINKEIRLRWDFQFISYKLMMMDDVVHFENEMDFVHKNIFKRLRDKTRV